MYMINLIDDEPPPPTPGPSPRGQPLPIENNPI
jgi:hypothetical protein